MWRHARISHCPATVLEKYWYLQSLKSYCQCKYLYSLFQPTAGNYSQSQRLPPRRLRNPNIVDISSEAGGEIGRSCCDVNRCFIPMDWNV